jgi:hypothetical protein
LSTTANSAFKIAKNSSAAVVVLIEFEIDGFSSKGCIHIKQVYYLEVSIKLKQQAFFN